LLFNSFLTEQKAFGVPAYPSPVEYKLPDGTKITVQLMGDEKIKWAQTIDGYTILIAKDGFYEYAIADNNGGITLSGIRVSESISRKPEEITLLKTIPQGLFYSPYQTSIMQQIWKMEENEVKSKGFPTTGDRKLVCILIGYPDKPFVKTKAEFENLFNQVGYTTGGATGSVKDFYLENSYNQFNLTVDVAGPYTASNNLAYYGGDNESGNDSRPRDLVTEAVNLANPDIDFANYDNDSDGYVDGVYVIFAGYGEEAGGGTDAIWSHAWNLSPSVTLDGKIISRYSCSPELRGNSGSNITRIGVICHEFGHVLGAPDYYDTDYETGGSYSGTGGWDLMAGGSWNNGGATPAHHNGYTKVYYYNWASATLLSTPSNVTIYNSAENSNSFFRINTTTPNEFFFLENREKHKFDAAIPGSGMIIYHVHSEIANAGNGINSTHPQRMYPVSANAPSDPTSTPSSYGSINSASCSWPGTSNKATFNDFSTPSSKSWAKLYTSKPITNITRNATDKTVNFDFMEGILENPSNFVAQATSNTQIDLSWQKYNGLDVLIAFSTSPAFGVPANGTNYSTGNVLSSGGTIIYAGSSTSFSHEGLSTATQYYYKIWTKMTTSPTWSAGLETNAWTVCTPFFSLPFAEGFSSTSTPGCWSVVDNIGNGQVWKFGTISTASLAGITGNYAYLNSHEYGIANSQNSDLITPTFNFSGFSSINLSFKHIFKQYPGSSVSFSYSINGGLTWELIQQWTISSANPGFFNQSLSSIAGEDNVLFKWNYTGKGGWYWAIEDVLVTGTPGVVSATPNALSNLSVYPNPFNEKINLTNVANVKVVSFTNILGQTVAEFIMNGEESTSISTSNIAKGIYFVAFQSQNGEKVVKKLVKD
jgi:M6 family metalloprotease-like protein